MSRRFHHSRFFILLVFVFATCSKDKDTTKAVIPKGTRQVAVHITQAESNSYDTEFQRVKEMGVDVIPITIPWSQLESTAGTFDFTLLDIIDLYYPAQNTKVSLNITPVNAASKALPSDLASKSFGDVAVKIRFRALIDSIQHHLPNTSINNFVLGVEADLYLTAHSSEWSSYKLFYDSSSTYLKKKWPGTKVGVEITWNAAVSTDASNVIALNEHSDMMVLSYYPNQSDFTVKPPDIVHADIESVIALYPGMPVFIIECGYQTSAACNSSEEKQQQFVKEMFSMWDDHADKVSFIGFLWLTDLSDAAVDKYVEDYNAAALPSLPAFKGYLQTTGLRTYAGTGTDKKGFTQLKTELMMRGWVH